MHVVTSGSYASQSVGSHQGQITLQETGAGLVWADINIEGFPLGQTEIGVYTIPRNKIGFVKSIHLHVDSTKSVDITAFQRQRADIVAAPFIAMRVWGQYHGISGHTRIHPDTPFGPFPACTDLGFMGKVTVAGGSALVDFEIILFDE